MAQPLAHTARRHCARAAFAAPTAARPHTIPLIRLPRQQYHPPSIQQHTRPHHRLLSTTPRTHDSQSRRASRPPTPPRPKPADNPDRGPASEEDTQTDFSALDVLGSTPAPNTSVDVCLDDGFLLDGGLRVRDGDGVLLLGSEAFVWRPWMATGGGGGAAPDGRILSGTEVRLAGRDGRGTGGLVNKVGQLDVAVEALGVLGAVWPRPDLLIVGTGATIRPLAPRTREALQGMGLRIEVLDTRNAASQFNLLATERSTKEVAAALLPIGFGR